MQCRCSMAHHGANGTATFRIRNIMAVQANFISSITLDAGPGYSGHLNKSCSLSKFTLVEMHKCRKNINNMPVGD